MDAIPSCQRGEARTREGLHAGLKKAAPVILFLFFSCAATHFLLPQLPFTHFCITADKCMDEWMDGWMDGWMGYPHKQQHQAERNTHTHTYIHPYTYTIISSRCAMQQRKAVFQVLDFQLIGLFVWSSSYAIGQGSALAGWVLAVPPTPPGPGTLGHGFQWFHVSVLGRGEKPISSKENKPYFVLDVSSWEKESNRPPARQPALASLRSLDKPPILHGWNR